MPLRFTDYLDLLLVKLYEADQSGPARLWNLTELSEQIGDVPDSWVLDAGKLLEARGLARPIYTFAGVHAEITGQGRLYVEEGRGLTRAAREDPGAHFVNVTGSQNQVVVGSQGVTVTSSTSPADERSPVLKLLAAIEKGLQRAHDLTGAERLEATTYVNLLRSEVRKNEPNRTLMNALIDALERVPAVAAQVKELVRWFNAAA